MFNLNSVVDKFFESIISRNHTINSYSSDNNDIFLDRWFLISLHPVANSSMTRKEDGVKNGVVYIHIRPAMFKDNTANKLHTNNVNDNITTIILSQFSRPIMYETVLNALFQRDTVAVLELKDRMRSLLLNDPEVQKLLIT